MAEEKASNNLAGLLVLAAALEDFSSASGPGSSSANDKQPGAVPAPLPRDQGSWETTKAEELLALRRGWTKV